jgi:hypothetical protein
MATETVNGNSDAVGTIYSVQIPPDVVLHVVVTADGAENSFAGERNVVETTWPFDAMLFVTLVVFAR